MQEGGLNIAHVAPLRIKKSQKDLRETGVTLSTISYGPQYDKELPDEPFSPRARFQNFLRASYPFQPQDQFSSTSVTIPLAAGDIVLVHSIHTNGWADGTLLETGARGWLPTNYCEPYDYATMRPLLKALTEFWDIIRSDGETSSELYRNHDYMRGMVAGVRFLLEKSDCLTRDAALVKQYDNIRKTRKGLLADLSILVKAAKTIQESNSVVVPSSDAALDDMLLKAFQVVTRAVNFFDIWSDEIASTKSRSPHARDLSFSPEPYVSSDSSTVHGTTSQITSNRTSMYGSQTSASGPGAHHFSRPRPASISRPPTVTHRMSYSTRSLQAYKGNFASEQLSDTYDAFLGVLASFLGSHMQSRSSSELLLTTQQAVKSCRKLLEIVEIILEHDVSGADELQAAKDMMYDKITSLVHAAREVFRPLHNEDDDMIYLPGEGARLVNAATACVSGAGRCVAKARVLLEDIGDFELELRCESIGEPSPFGTNNLSPSKSAFESMLSGSTTASRRASIAPIDTALEREGSDNVAQPYMLSSEPMSTGEWTPATQNTGSPISEKSIMSADIPEDSSAQAHRRALAGSMLHGSESTLVSSARDSGPSFVSQTSTRATSPDSHAKTSPRHVEEDRDEGEDALMEHYYAHEILSSSDGRILGASLNAIIERLTAHDATPDQNFTTMVFLTFRIFATPTEFAEALISRFDYITQSPRIAQPVQLRVCNIFKGWLESHWRHDCDEVTIPYIADFIEHKVITLSISASGRLRELLNTVATTHGPAVPRVLSAMGKTNTAISSKLEPDHPAPPPVLSKSQLNSLKTWRMGGGSAAGLCVIDFDALELARQLTLKTSSIFCSILPEELLGCEFMKQSSSLAVNLRALSQLSTDVGNLVVESILAVEDTKKRAAAIKQWIKVAAKCHDLHNYETMMTINASLNAASVLRLRKTWDTLGQKTKALHDQHSEICSHTKNYAGLRQRFENASLPCIPYVGIYRTDLIFTDQGNPATRVLETGESSISVVNIDKHMKTAKYISDLQRFQVPYKLTSVDELQTWLQDECVRVRAAGDRSIQNQYRRSLVLEPKLDATLPQQSNKMKAFTSMTALTSKDKFEFLTRSHAPKDKERANSLGTL